MASKAAVTMAAEWAAVLADDPQYSQVLAESGCRPPAAAD
jgi:hypothetical protein